MLLRAFIATIFSTTICFTSSYAFVSFDINSNQNNTVIIEQTPAAIIHNEADKQGVPRAFAIKVATRESRLSCEAYNKNGHTFGLFQLKPSTAKGLGFKGTSKQLYNCNIGARYGVKHLAICYRLAHGNWKRADFCHRAGFRSISGRHTVEREIRQALNEQ